MNHPSLTMQNEKGHTYIQVYTDRRMRHVANDFDDRGQKIHPCNKGLSAKVR